MDKNQKRRQKGGEEKYTRGRGENWTTS